MNRRQRITAQVAGVLLLLAILFPPSRLGGIENGVEYFYGRVSWNLLGTGFGEGLWGTSWPHLALEFAIIAIVAGLVFISIKDKE